MAALPVESSWRMVEGEHDSFDTSIVPNAFGLSGEYGDDGENDDPFISSSGAPSQQSAGSGLGTTAPNRHGLGKRTVSGVSAASGASRGGASSSQEDRISLGGESFGGSVGGSQDDDIHSFLRKAENDERVLLRSPFQPSLPSSVRQSPMSASSAGKAGKSTKTAANTSTTNSRLDRTSYQTPEPEFRMPTIDMDGSLHGDDSRFQNHRVTGISSSFRVSDTGSPFQRRRTGGGLLSRLNMTANRSKSEAGSSEISENGSTSRSNATSAAAAWRRAVPSIRTFVMVLLPLLGLAAAYFTTPLFYLTAIDTVCPVPGVSHLGLPFCPPSTVSTDDNTVVQEQPDDGELPQNSNYWAIRHRFKYDNSRDLSEEQVSPPVNPVVSLVRSAGQLMRVQTQLADVVKERVLVRHSRDNKVPPAQDAWLVPRSQTKDLRLAAQILSGQASKQEQGSKSRNSATMLLIELDAYLDAAKRVSIALTRLQTGAAATAADTLAYRSRQTLAQLQRIASATQETIGSDHAGNSWLSRVFPSTTSTRRTQLLDTYRHHVDAVLAKTQLRVAEAEAVFRSLETAGLHLAGVQRYVVAKKLELLGDNFQESTGSSTDKSAGTGGPGGDPLLETSGGLFSWLWSVVFGRQPEDAHILSSSSSPKMSKAARAWSGYADKLQQLHEQHDTAVGRAAEALDELSAVRDALTVLQTDLAEDNEDAKNDGYDNDLDMRLHMDIVDAGIQDLEKVGR